MLVWYFIERKLNDIDGCEFEKKRKLFLEIIPKVML